MDRIRPYPLFFFSERRGQKSDLPWIQARLMGLSQEDASRASEEYAEIYKRHINKKEYREARENANGYLVSQLEEFGLSSEEIDKLEKSEATKQKIKKMVEKCKAARPLPKSILGISKKEKAYK